MDMSNFTSRPLRLTTGSKRDVRTQFGALCWREREGTLQFCLVTTRRTRRWVIPKGWPVHNATPAEAAAAEAVEEAGVTGRIEDVCVGIFTYIKELDGDGDLPCVVAVFPFKVEETLEVWPEKAERARRWVSALDAARLVHEPELARIILNFDPKRQLV